MKFLAAKGHKEHEKVSGSASVNRSLLEIFVFIVATVSFERLQARREISPQIVENTIRLTRDRICGHLFQKISHENSGRRTE